MMQDKSKFGRLMYMFQAGLEYLVSLLVAGSFLATLTKEIGFSDSLTGILSSIISLGCLFQLLSVFIRRKRMKGFVTITSILNMLLFMLLYVLPLSGMAKPVKTAVFVAVIILAYIIYNIAHPKKINWFMSHVEDCHRGTFTANKEISSLVAGIIFSFAMGSMVDHFAAIGNIRMAFILCAVVIFVLTVLHTLTMVLTSEKETVSADRNLKQTLIDIGKDKNMLRVTGLFIIYYISSYITGPFLGTYNIGELGFSLQFVSILAMVGSVSRILVSRFWGRYADKNSFARMIEKCFMFLAFAYLCVAFSTPKTGKVALTLYYLLHGIAMGGINSALINLVFDYVAPEKRADSMAICQASAGTVGFLSTLCVSPLVAYIQKNGNRIFGLPIYAQQLLAMVSVVIAVLAILYIRKVVMKNAKSETPLT